MPSKKKDSGRTRSIPTISHLSGEEIQICCLKLESDAEEMARSWLSADEVARAERFVSARLQENFIRSRVFLRQVLAHHLKIDPKEVSFTYGAHGKPYVRQNDATSTLHFSFTHSGCAALLAVAWDLEIGIDLEQWRTVDQMEDIAKRFFSQEEAGKLLALPEESRLEAFFRCWTAKEAFVKATGEGLSRALGSFSVSFLADEPARINTVSDPTDTQWNLFYLQKTLPGYSAALVTKGADTVKISVNNGFDD